jgi:shikimate dehydrogenase
MSISAPKDLYGLVGYPVKHSYSAFMHNAAFAHYGMNAEYHLFEVPPEKLEAFFRVTIPELKIRGLNVTIPHKEKACDYLTGSVSFFVHRNKAVNTVRVELDGNLSGYNTDGPGFTRDLAERGIVMAGRRVVLLGAGGGARAVAMALANKGIAALEIYDLDVIKAKVLVSIIKEFFPSIVVSCVEDPQAAGMAEADILVNATPVGMKPQDPLIIKKEALSSRLFVYDLIYNPSATPLLKAAQDAGCKTANGLGMLLHQGCLAFEYWTGKPAPVEVMREALLEAVGK